jgi:hypothetical protein
MAGRQRMLTQRIVKLYCQAGMGVATELSQRQLAESVALFGQQLDELERFARTAAPREAVARLRSDWPEARSLALAPPTREGALRLQAVAERLLAAAHDLTTQLEAGSALGWLVNLSGRQRMVSQRLAKLYMMRAWGLELAGHAAQIESAQGEFALALSQLMRAGENTAEIDRELFAIGVQWEWFGSAIALEGVASYALVVADVSENMLRSLERVVSLYERAAIRY